MEVEQRRLYEQHGFDSIYEFAAKVGGMNHENIKSILKLSKKLKDKPALHSLLTQGEVGWSKLRVVVSVASSFSIRYRAPLQSP